MHRQCFWWADIILQMNPYWKLSVKGLEHIDQNQAYVIIANHQSLADTIVLYETKMQFKWVAKKSLFNIPFIGWCMQLCKYIMLKRDDLNSIKESIQEASQWLRDGISVLYFPEGTRSEDGRLGLFKNGPFKLAIREQKPILPITISGTKNAIPKGSWVFTRHVFGMLSVLPPMSTEGLTEGDSARLREHVHEILEKELKASEASSQIDSQVA